ncbi:MAG: hypothetical protein HY365_03145 [Candidatus Aenigmarchaeota archaeon]|nr:hypothetical protein [Candidatus Aenigmarchaeota archaeon]
MDPEYAMRSLKEMTGYLTERFLLSLDDARDQNEHLAHRVADMLGYAIREEEGTKPYEK